jgi:GTPase SAR1 family protein
MKPNMRSSVAFSVNAKMNFRVIIVGDSAVGKTSLIVKYVKGIFNKNYTVSLGVEFYSKVVNVEN